MASIRVRRVPGAPVVAIRVWLPGGSTAEGAPGQALVSGRLLLEGTKNRNWREISAEAEKRGIAMVGDAGYEAQGLAIDALADDWELALDWAAEMVLDSVFPQDRCRWLARQAAAELEQLADHPDVKTAWAFARQLYGSAARGRPLQGSLDSLAELDASVCRAFHESCVHRGCIVTVAGDISEAAVETKVQALFNSLSSPEGRVPGRAQTGGDIAARQEVAFDQSEQAHWFGGAVTCSRTDPDYWALGLAGIVLGAEGQLGGRISHRVRERDGLAYSCSVATCAGAGREAGGFTVAIGTSPERELEVEAAVIKELQGLVTEGVTEDELRHARAYLLGREPFGRETARQWATLMAQAELFGVPVDDAGWVGERWLEVTEEDILQVARRYLHPRRLKVTAGSPAAGKTTATGSASC